MAHKRFYSKRCEKCGKKFTVEHDDYDDVYLCNSCEQKSKPRK